MSAETAQTGRSDRAPNVSKRIGRPFGKGNSGRPKGVKDRRVVAGQLAAQALESHAWDVVESLLTGRSTRVRLEAARTILAYAIGLPRQTLELAGLGDVAGELARALAEVRARRLSAENAHLPEVRIEAAEPSPALPTDVREGDSLDVAAGGPIVPNRDPGASPAAALAVPANEATEAGLLETGPVEKDPGR